MWSDFTKEILKKIALGGGFLLLILLTIYIIFTGVLWK